MKRLCIASRLKICIIAAVFVLLSTAFQTAAFGESDGVTIQFKKTTVFTPRDTSVSAMICSEAIAPAQISTLIDQWMTTIRFHAVQVVSDATYAYNSHGYTWYISEGGQGELHIKNPQPYLEDGSYIKIKASEAAEGDKVLYGNGLHSAVVADTPGWVISKWGNGPLVKHRLRDIPAEFGPDLELTFYRKASPLAPPSNLRIVQIVQ